ncbi:MAG TPA: lanthionine synthetase LanC family protein [Balneolaceae bacterium]|nr:lanthionine synthetase LanC family protein [Balneolaceae bacterium]
MDHLPQKIFTINELLAREVSSLNNIGLLNGKMGLSIYLFHFARKTGNEEPQKMAGKLIDEVYREISRKQPPLNFENGLAGIAWGVEYLVQNEFVKADTDEILSEVDDKIYSQIVSQKEKWKETGKIIGYLIYIISRLRGKNLSSEKDASVFIFQRLLEDLINQLSQSIEEEKLSVREPLMFNISWELPIALLLLAAMKEMNVYIYKIDQILNYLSPMVLSLFPHSPGNKLYLIYALEKVLQYSELPKWEEHADLMGNNLELLDIIERDLNDKNIFFNTGFAGVSYISRQLYVITKDERILFQKEKIIKKIIESEYWKVLEKDKAERKNLGLHKGLAGVAMELLALSEKQITEK